MKTNIELARECQLLDGLAVVPSQVDRYTALVEARLMAKLLEGAGEPVAWALWWDETPEYFADDYISKYREVVEEEFLPTVVGNPRVVGLHTPDQIAAAVLRERTECADECDELASFLACHGDKAGAGICTSMAESIRNRGTK